MNAFLIILTLIIILAVWYALKGREWLKSKSWAQSFFAWIEPLEITLFQKSETILFARLQQVLGVILTGLTFLGTIDLTPVKAMAPPKLAWLFDFIPMAITLLGMISEYLRKRVTAPLAVVAAPSTVSAATTAVVAAAADANAVAVDMVKAEAAKGAA